MKGVQYKELNFLEPSLARTVHRQVERNIPRPEICRKQGDDLESVITAANNRINGEMNADFGLWIDKLRPNVPDKARKRHEKRAQAYD